MSKLFRICKRSLTTKDQISYGFIGLGQMGSRMANNLLTKSSSILNVYDVYEPSTQQFKGKERANIASSPKDVALNSDIIITMLRNGEQVSNVLNELKDSIKDDALIMDSSTIDYQDWINIVTKFKQETKAKNVDLVDCPVSGGIGAAQAGTLAFLVGGPTQSYNKAKDVLQYMGLESKIFHCGTNYGDGQIAKCANNMLLAISMIGVSEAMNLGIKLGMDAKVLANVISNSSGRCWSIDTYPPVPNVMDNVPSSNKYNGGFVVNLMRKDLSLALKAAQNANASTPLGSNAKMIYDMISERGFDEKDFGFVYQWIKGSETNIKQE